MTGRKIKLQTCFAFPGEVADRMTLPEGVKTVKDFLVHMGSRMDFRFLNPETGDVEEDLEIILNKKEIWFYPAALDTLLKDEDCIEIYLLPLGGG